MPDFLEGEVVLVDKPLEWTSFDAVNKFRHLLRKSTSNKKIKVGHAGTLDPLATGLLVICTGKKTKTIDQIQGQQKEYTGTIQLGATTASYDRETPLENEVAYDHLTEADIKKAAKEMEGEQEQLPPVYSAKKVEGKRAYDLARKGEKPLMKTKKVEIYSFEIESIHLPEIQFRISCSKGTYIRSIANDLGEKLKVGGFLKSLRRTKIGEYKVEDAFKIEDLEAYANKHKAI